MSCQHPELSDKIVAWLDGALPREEARAVEAHMSQCSSCQEEAACLKGITSRLAGAFRAQKQSPLTSLCPPPDELIDHGMSLLAPSAARIIDEHLALCLDCREQAALLRDLDEGGHADAGGDDQAQEPPVSLALRRAFARSFGSGAEGGKGDPVTVPTSRWGDRVVRARKPLSLVATLAVVFGVGWLLWGVPDAVIPPAQAPAVTATATGAGEPAPTVSNRAAAPAGARPEAKGKGTDDTDSLRVDKDGKVNPTVSSAGAGAAPPRSAPTEASGPPPPATEAAPPGVAAAPAQPRPPAKLEHPSASSGPSPSGRGTPVAGESRKEVSAAPPPRVAPPPVPVAKAAATGGGGLKKAAPPAPWTPDAAPTTAAKASGSGAVSPPAPAARPAQAQHLPSVSVAVRQVRTQSPARYQKSAGPVGTLERGRRYPSEPVSPQPPAQAPGSGHTAPDAYSAPAPAATARSSVPSDESGAPVAGAPSAPRTNAEIPPTNAAPRPVARATGRDIRANVPPAPVSTVTAGGASASRPAGAVRSASEEPAVLRGGLANEKASSAWQAGLPGRARQVVAAILRSQDFTVRVMVHPSSAITAAQATSIQVDVVVAAPQSSATTSQIRGALIDALQMNPGRGDRVHVYAQ